MKARGACLLEINKKKLISKAFVIYLDIYSYFYYTFQIPLELMLQSTSLYLIFLRSFKISFNQRQNVPFYRPCFQNYQVVPANYQKVTKDNELGVLIQLEPSNRNSLIICQMAYLHASILCQPPLCIHLFINIPPVLSYVI